MCNSGMLLSSLTGKQRILFGSDSHAELVLGYLWQQDWSAKRRMRQTNEYSTLRYEHLRPPIQLQRK
eukprot:6433577-Amphidinium_carterae.1